MELRHKKAGKVVRPKRTNGGGIKAIIPCPVLRRLVYASKRWYAFTKISDGETAAERSALASAIPVAEAVLKKFERRNLLAFESRERKRAREDMQDARNVGKRAPAIQGNRMDARRSASGDDCRDSGKTPDEAVR